MSKRISPIGILLASLIVLGIPFAYSSGLSTVPDAPTTLPVSLAFSALYLLIFYLLFRFTRIWPGRPLWWWISALLWGAFPVFILVKVAGSSLSTLTKQLGLPLFSASLAGGFPEEIAKFIGVFLIAATFSQINKPWHVFAVGIFVGVGFILTENIGYAATGAMLDPNSDVQGAIQMWINRSKFGFGLHASFTSIGAWGLGKALFSTHWSRSHKIAVTLFWFMIGFGLHFAWNASPTDPLVNLAKIGVTAIIGYGLFLLLFLRARKMAKSWELTARVQAGSDGQH